MKEITRIIDAKITIVEKIDNTDDVDLILNAKSDAEENVKATLHDLYNAEDVQVEIHDFVMDKE